MIKLATIFITYATCKVRGPTYVTPQRNLPIYMVILVVPLPLTQENVDKIRYQCMNITLHPLRLLALHVAQKQTVFVVVLRIGDKEHAFVQVRIRHASLWMPGCHSLPGWVHLRF